MSGEIHFVTEGQETRPEATESEEFLCDLGTNLCRLCVQSETP
jgi:hypothetical protein